MTNITDTSINKLFSANFCTESFINLYLNGKNDSKQALEELKKLLIQIKNNSDDMLLEIKLKQHETTLEEKRNTNDLVTYAQAALELNCSVKTIKNWIVKYDIKTVQNSHNKVYITRSDLLFFKSKK